MAPISPSASFLIPINQRGSFFEDAYFQDTREDFHRAVRDVLTRRDRGRPTDKSRDPRSRDLSCYRRLRQQDDFEFDEDSQALTITEDEEQRKILLDVKEFHPDGEIKVHAMTNQELLVDGRHQDSKTGRVLSFSRTFKLPWYADLSCGFFSVDISSDGVLRIVTTKKAPSTGRSIPLILDYQEGTENEAHQESYNSTNNNNNSSNKRNVAFSMNGSQEEAYNYTNGSINSNSESEYCTSKYDNMREEPHNKTKERVIPVVFVKSQTNKGSSKVSQNSSSNQESTVVSNHQGSSQYSTNQDSTSNTSSNKNCPVKSVITTTFEVKPNTNKSIPAKQHEIVIPVIIKSKTSSQRTNSGECTKQQQSHRNVPVTNENDSTNNSVSWNQRNKDLILQNSEMKRIIPITVEKKKDKAKDADSSKSKTAKKVCFTILNKKTKADNTDKQNKDITKDIKRNNKSKEFIIPLTIEGDSADEKPVQTDSFRKVDIGTQDQKKKKSDNKPPINQYKKTQPVSPQPKKISISNIFKGQDDQMKERKSSITSDHKEYNRSESTNNKPPPSPSKDRKHLRSSSIEDRLSIFTRMSPGAERKSRKDFMDEIRGNGRGTRSRSRSVEELVNKFDKMSPQAERRVLNRKNSLEEMNEIAEKKQVMERKGSIIPIEIEGETENYHSSLKQICSQISDLNNAPDMCDGASYDEKYYNTMGQNINKENSNTQEIKPVVRRRESIIPIKMEYEEGDEIFTTPHLEGILSADAKRKENNDAQKLNLNTPVAVECNDKINQGLISDHSKVSNVDETEKGKIYDSTPSNNSLTKNSSDAFANDENTKVNNDDDGVSSISSSSVIEDENSVASADEDYKKTSKGTAKKSSKRKVKRKQSIPGVQVSEDETGETTVLIRGRSSSTAGRKKKNVDNSSGSLRDADDHCNSPHFAGEKSSPSQANITVEANIAVKADGTAHSLAGFSNEIISDSIGNEIVSNILEVKDLTNYSGPNGTNLSNLLLQKEQSNTYNLLNSMSNLQQSIPDSTQTVHDYSNLKDRRNESPRKGKVYGRTSVSQLVSDESERDGSDSVSTHQSRSKFRDNRASVKFSSKITPDKSPTNQSNNNQTLLNCSDVSENPNIGKLTSDTEVISNVTSFETPDKDMSSEKIDTENKESNDTTEKSNEIKVSRRTSVLPNLSDLSKIKPPKNNEKENIKTNQSTQKNTDESNKNEDVEQNVVNIKESRRASVLPNPSDLLKIKPPKKNKMENTKTNQSTQNNTDESNKNEDVEQNSVKLKESRRASVLPNPSDLLKIKPPKKNKKEKSETNQSTQNNTDESNKKENVEQNSVKLKESRRASVLPNPSDLLKIKPPMKIVSESNSSSKISVSLENPENSESSLDIQKPKSSTDNAAPPIESEQQTNQIDSQQTQTDKITPHCLVPKDNVITDKVIDTKVTENISENSLNPEALKSCDDSTTKLEPPPSPALRRKTSFKKYKVFENKRTPSPSPIRRPDSLTSTKTEQFVFNKIDENTSSKKEETNIKKEESCINKNESKPTAKNSKVNTCVNIENKDMFFSDPFFKDHRQLFMGGVREALKRSGITSMKDKLRVYRELRLKGQTEENQAICSAEDETSYKAVLDMTEFLEGEIKIKTMSSTEILIEATSKSGNKSTPFSHSLPFPDSIIMEGVSASLSEDGILAINAPKTNPDTED